MLQRGGATLKVPLLDLRKQYEMIKKEVISVTEQVYESQQFILGPKVEELERKIAEYCHCKYAVGVSSGTDALLIALMTAGVGSGDLVITSPYTFFATGGSIARVGAKPVFVDIEERTYNMDPTKLEDTVSSMNKKERPKLKAIMPVHLFGQTADMEPILDFAERYNLIVVEDAAQAIGSEYLFKDGSVKRAGSMGEYGCFSFFPSKNLGAFGDGGMVTTDHEGISERLKVMRGHGAKPKYFHKMIGGNFRLDALQAAILTVKLRYLDQWTKGRIGNARLYGELFERAELKEIILPLEKERRHIYNQYVIRLKNKRDQLRIFLNSKGIGTEIYYPVSLHMQDCFRYLGYRSDDFPVSRDAAEKTLALPIFPELTPDQITYVVEAVKEFFVRGA
jgi:dTDP-4-amino-4,6-dideoxygalactose transaminase